MSHDLPDILNHCVKIEFCSMEGRELFERIQSKGDDAFTEKEASKITRQICEALSCLHSKNIAHRDIKVDTIIFWKPLTT